jgi:hypothetical protein
MPSVRRRGQAGDDPGDEKSFDVNPLGPGSFEVEGGKAESNGPSDARGSGGVERTRTVHVLPQSDDDGADGTGRSLAHTMSTGNVSLDRLRHRNAGAAADGAEAEDMGNPDGSSALLSVIAGLLGSSILLLAVWSIHWGNTSTHSCAGRPCSSCGDDDACTWCPGPDPTMPGYCDHATQYSDAMCSAVPDAQRCFQEEAKEARWTTCGAYAEQSACENTESQNETCTWCGEDSAHTGCVPFRTDDSSFCDPDRDLLFGARPFALSSHTPACSGAISIAVPKFTSCVSLSILWSTSFTGYAEQGATQRILIAPAC